MNSIPVKASRVARQAALKQLEERLGAFRGPLAVQQGTDDAPAQHAENGSPDPADALPLITAATNWPELHAGLAELCMRYEKAGGGATIIVDGKRHSAGSVARQASLKQLEKRLGPFKAAPAAQHAESGNSDPADAVPLIAAATNWTELHASLAELCMRYEKVGGGATIIVDGKRRHRASSVARQASLTQLEKRLGPFKAAPAAQHAESGNSDPAGAVPLIAAATNWPELHASLAGLCMRYEKVGGGATIIVDGKRRHSAGSVVRQASLTQLEKRLGPFKAAPAAQQGIDGAPGQHAEHGGFDPTDVKPLIAAASSWAEFHAGLAELGMRYERVGSGAAITSRRDTAQRELRGPPGFVATA